jgi:hypothetical protein
MRFEVRNQSSESARRFAFTERQSLCHIFIVKRPPESFFRDYEAFRERMDWAERADLHEDLVQSQLTYADMREFLNRWEGKTGVSELELVLTRMRSAVDNIGQGLEVEYLKALVDLLERRHTALIHPLIFKTGVTFLEIMKTAPEKLRPGLEKVFKESIGYDFDAERFYRENEADFEKYEAEYAQALAQMEVTWPDHFTTETRARLTHAAIEEINAWKAEVAAKLNS